MNEARRKTVRRTFATVSAVALATLLAVLLVNHVRYASRFAQFEAQLDEAEQAARADAQASAALQEVVDRQTSQSLAHWRRQRGVGIAALAVAGICVSSLHRYARRKPELPRTLAASMPTRAEPDSSSKQAAQPLSTATKPATDRTDEAPIDLSPIESIVARVGREQRRLIPLLHAIEQEYRYLPTSALQRLCEVSEVSPAQVAGVASFYSQFRTKPRGEHVLQVCRGTACHVAGADRVLQELRRSLNIRADDDIDPEGQFTVETVGCLGCCTLAPVVQADDRTVGHVGVDDLPSIIAECRSSAPGGAVSANGMVKAHANEVRSASAAAPPLEIRIGVGSCCVAGGSRAVMETLERELARQRLEAVVKPVGCVGICHLTPMVEVIPQDGEPIVATRATPADVRRIVRALPARQPLPLRLQNRISGLLRRDDAAPGKSASCCQLSPLDDDRISRFTDRQVRIVTEHSGLLEPTSLDDYRRRGGFVALKRSLERLEPDAVIDAIEASGLRGRGGGGFATARKWRLVHEQTGEKYLVCNGDEGDPGAFMDRMVLESYPFRVLEGMAIAAHAVGAHRAVLYIRHEYPLAVERVRHAIDQMLRENLLGEDVLGTGFSLEVEVVEGAGAFVCGEETALLQSIMGQRGTPLHRPPYPVEKGLWDRPTLVNNVETFANVPWILRNGPERFAALGTARSKGTKVFSLAGKVRRGGLVEIPMGLTLREVVEDIGGGVQDGKRFKAVQIGGPSGGCVPASLADTPIDFEALREVGAIMGSGGLVVMDEDDCMVDVARYFLEFTQQESCGHCTFCRVGTRRLLDILERICAGKGAKRDLDEIESMSRSVTLGSLCGLGKTAPNPVLTTLRYFREEYEAHLEGRCPAGRCKGLIRYEATNNCTGCTLCAEHCPVGAIPATPYRQHVIDADICTRCDVCRTTCPEDAIRIV